VLSLKSDVIHEQVINGEPIEMMPSRITGFINNLSVAKKLLLICLLDLSAVIFITAILIHEKYLAIDFSRKEIAGNHYIVAARESVFALIGSAGDEREANRQPTALNELRRAEATLVEAEERYGKGLHTGQLQHDLVRSIRGIITENERERSPGSRELHARAVTSAMGLIARIGDQSNLILDPDLDSYYTMSLVLLRFPEVVSLLLDHGERAQKSLEPGRPGDSHSRFRLLVIEGKLAAAQKAIESDFNAACRNDPSGRLKERLGQSHTRLLSSLRRIADRQYGMTGGTPSAQQAHREALLSLHACWRQGSHELDLLLHDRIDSYFRRMWLHLGTACLLVGLILLSVFYIARRIVAPIRDLATIAGKVQLTNDYTLRAEREGNDEIGELVNCFNSMLERLDTDRIIQQELVAAARASHAQRALFESIPLPLTVTSLNDHKLRHVNTPAMELFMPDMADAAVESWSPFDAIAEEKQRTAFFALLGEGKNIDEYELLLRLPGATSFWSQVSVRPVNYQGEEAFLTLFTPINLRKQLEEGVRNEKAFSQAALDSLPGIFFMLGSDFRILSTNRNFDRFRERTSPGSASSPVELHVPQDQREKVRSMVREGFRRGTAEAEVSLQGSSSREIYLLTSRLFLLGGEDCLITVGIDISARRQAEATLELWGRVFECTSESIMITDAEQRIVSVNQAFSAATGYRPEEIVGQSSLTLRSDMHDGIYFRQLWRGIRKRGSWQGEFWCRHKNGDVSPQWMVVNTVHDRQGTVTNYIALFTDISVQKSQEQRIQHIAHHDALTNLPNRLLCMERLILALQQAHRNGRHVAVIFIDLDHFKNINDSLGHHVGDCVLVTAANRLSMSVRDGDTISRLGGDEFVIILADIEDSLQIEEIMRHRLLPLMRQPYDAGGYELHCSCSIGISIFPEDGLDKETLLRNADTAMYRAKEVGRNTYHFYTEEMNSRAMQRLSIETSLRKGMERDELLLHYQPKLDLHTGKPCGLEALLRWQHPDNGMISPMEFIPIAEETGLIIPIGKQVIRTACRQLSRWSSAGMPPIGLSLNVSAVQFRDRRFVEDLMELVREEGVSPHRIELELTETMLMEDAVRTIRVMETLKDEGFQFSIDDFGTGYSSLNYLHRFPIDCLKIDRSFIRGMLERPADLAIIKAIIGLGHTLDMRVIAEGVEKEEEYRALRAAGCDGVQGYFVARPLTPEQVPEWLRARERGGQSG
jgi:diguanylate cyclase (GGDEF)-like protein/PAS domain S-box-containing protein